MAKLTISGDDANDTNDVKEESKETKDTETTAPSATATPTTDTPPSTTATATTAATATTTDSAAPTSSTAPEVTPTVPDATAAAPPAPQPNYYGSTPSAPVPPPAPPVIHQPSNIGRESGKMFIGGLNWDTTEDKLVAYFSKYGEVTDHTIMRDNATGKSRGFGFLTFRDPRSVDEVIKTDHVLDGKLIDPKRAIAREEQDRVGKIFVGGIDPMVNERDFNEFFSQFGSIIDAQLMIDKDTGRSRGFGFITYDSPDAVDRVTVNKYLTLKGKTMEVKRAEPRGQHQQNQQHQQYGYGYNQYGQVQNNGQYGQQPQMTPEMMQEYWQRMQQWYMYQQQVAAGQTEGGEQPVQPLNPQQQGEEEKKEPEAPTQPAAFENRNENRNDNNPHKDTRRNNLPKGPRRAPPSGPGAMRAARGGRGRGGYQRRGGYHPYNRGGRN